MSSAAVVIGALRVKDISSLPAAASGVCYRPLHAKNLTLNAPIATKVVCFSRLLKCLSLYGKQCGPRSEQSVLGPRCLLLYLIRQ